MKTDEEIRVNDCICIESFFGDVYYAVVHTTGKNRIRVIELNDYIRDKTFQEFRYTEKKAIIFNFSAHLRELSKI